MLWSIELFLSVCQHMPQPGALALCCTPAWQVLCWEPFSWGLHGKTMPGKLVGDWTQSRSSSALSCCQTFSSRPCSTLLLDASWLQMSREEEEVLDSIQILASDLGQVTVTSWTVTVPASSGRAWAAGGVLAGQGCCLHMMLPLRTPVLLAMRSPFSCSLFVYQTNLAARM